MSLLAQFPTVVQALEKVKEIEWSGVKKYAEENPLEGMLVGGLCFIASMGMDILISILRWGGLGAVALFGYILLQKKKSE